jgi:putative sterol carrier protein
VQYFTLEFFRELASRLNAHPGWQAKTGSTNFRALVSLTDRGKSFLLKVEKGKVEVHEVPLEEPADFKLEGTSENWMRFTGGEADLPTLVMTGRLRFKGSMARIMALQDQIAILGQVAREIRARP